MQGERACGELHGDLGCGWEATQTSELEGLEANSQAANTRGLAGLAAKDKQQWVGRVAQKR